MLLAHSVKAESPYLYRKSVCQDIISEAIEPRRLYFEEGAEQDIFDGTSGIMFEYIYFFSSSLRSTKPSKVISSLRYYNGGKEISKMNSTRLYNDPICSYRFYRQRSTRCRNTIQKDQISQQQTRIE